jgi:hypothetical protein
MRKSVSNIITDHTELELNSLNTGGDGGRCKQGN